MDGEGREVGRSDATAKGHCHIGGKPTPRRSENCHAGRKARVRGSESHWDAVINVVGILGVGSWF